MAQYSSCLNRGLTYQSTLERSVYKIFTTTPLINKELSDYIPILQACIGKLTSMTSLMNAFRTKYCQCLAQISWTSTANDSTLKSNVDSFDNKLRQMQTKISTSSSSALIEVKKASSETSNVYLPPLQVVLERQNRSDYPNTTWSNVQNCNDLLNRGKFLLSKQLQYLQALPSANLDCSLISFYLNAITLTKSTSVSLNKTIDELKIVEFYCKSYVTLLTTAIVRISVMAADVNSHGDTFCSCVTTTTTTTTARPCGIVLLDTGSIVFLTFIKF